MTIVIDARLNAYRNGGIPQYTRQLIYAMAEVAPTTAMTILQHRRQPERLVSAPNISRQVIYTPPHHRWDVATRNQLYPPQRGVVPRLHCAHAAQLSRRGDDSRLGVPAFC